MKLSYVAFALLLCTSVSVFGARKSLESQVSGQGYGMAGCGLGSILFGPQDGAIQIVAATFNGTSANQTFGITSGTSNCVPGGAHHAEQFIQVNKEALAKDVSRGRGETVDGLADILGCSNSAKLGTALQSRFSEIFPSENAEASQITHSIYGVIRADKSLSCQHIG